jgi:hypothetical protein
MPRRRGSTRDENRNLRWSGGCRMRPTTQRRTLAGNTRHLLGRFSAIGKPPARPATAGLREAAAGAAPSGSVGFSYDANSEAEGQNEFLRQATIANHPARQIPQPRDVPLRPSANSPPFTNGILSNLRHITPRLPKTATPLRPIQNRKSDVSRPYPPAQPARRPSL